MAQQCHLRTVHTEGCVESHHPLCSRKDFMAASIYYTAGISLVSHQCHYLLRREEVEPGPSILLVHNFGITGQPEKGLFVQSCHLLKTRLGEIIFRPIWEITQFSLKKGFRWPEERNNYFEQRILPGGQVNIKVFSKFLPSLAFHPHLVWKDQAEENAYPFKSDGQILMQWEMLKLDFSTLSIEVKAKEKSNVFKAFVWGISISLG